MLTVEISLPEVEELQKLVQEGLEKGVLNYDEIANGLEDVELTKEQIEDFYTYLVDHGVELLEGETHKHPPHEQLPTPEEEKGPKLDLSVEPSLDSLRLYLREIGKVPLLTADQEVSLAKRIEGRVVLSERLARRFALDRRGGELLGQGGDRCAAQHVSAEGLRAAVPDAGVEGVVVSR